MWLTVRHFVNVQHYFTNLEQYTTESTDVNDRVFSNIVTNGVEFCYIQYSNLTGLQQIVTECRAMLLYLK
jgi:hypothetical protein